MSFTNGFGTQKDIVSGKEYPLLEVTRHLPAFLQSIPLTGEIIRKLPEQYFESKSRRAYISRISFIPLTVESWQENFDTLSEFLLMEYLDSLKRVWTCHKSVRPGDLLFMVLAKSAEKGLKDMAALLKSRGYTFPEPWAALFSWVKNNKMKLFAWSYYCSEPEDVGSSHKKWRYQAKYGEVQYLSKPLDVTNVDYTKNPIARDEIVGGAGTDMSPHRYLSSKSFNVLRDAIMVDNPNQSLSTTSVTTFGEGADVNSENWISKIQSYDDFWAECHVREIFTDQLMRQLSDDGTYLAEVQPKRNGVFTGKFADYVICIGGRWIPVEVKYAAKTVWNHLVEQVLQYVDCEYIHPETGKVITVQHCHILVVDRDSLWLWRGCQPVDKPILKRKEISIDCLNRVRMQIEAAIAD